MLIDLYTIYIYIYMNIIIYFYIYLFFIRVNIVELPQKFSAATSFLTCPVLNMLQPCLFQEQIHMTPM